MSSFGGTVKLTGESEYRKALSQITQNLKETSSALTLVDSQYAKNDNSIATVTAKNEKLNKILEKQKNDYNNLKASFDSINKTYQEQISAHNKLQSEYDEEKTELEKLKKTQGESSNAYKEQKEKVADLATQLNKSQQNIDANETAMSKLRVQMNNSETAINKTSSEINNLGKETENTTEHIKDAKEGFTVFKGVLSNLITNVIQKATSALKDLTKETLQVGMNFEASMSKVKAVSGATGDEVEKLTKKAEEMGSKTKFSATESAEAFNYMAMAGWKTEDMLNGIEGIMNLAAASGSDLATTSDIVTDALTGFGKSAADAGRLADIMAAASSNANTNVEMLGETFKYVTPVAGSLGISMEDTALAVGLMANAGIKSTQAGTALRSILVRLSTDAGATSKSLGALGTLTQELGVEFYNTDGTVRNLSDVLVDARKNWSKLSAEQQTNYAKTIAGQEAMAGWLSLMNASESDFNKLSTSINNSTGSAQKMADTMNDNVQGAMTLFKSQIEGIQIQIFKKMEPAIRKAIKAFSDMVSKVNWDNFGEKVKKALDKVMKGFEWVIQHHKQIINAIKLVIAAFAVSKILSFTKSLSDMSKGFIELAKGTALSTTAANANTTAVVANTAAEVAGTGATSALTVATNLLNAAWKSNPIGIVIAAVVALIAVMNKLSEKSKQLAEAEQENLSAIQEETQKVKDSKKAWDDLITAKQDNINIGMTEISNYQALYKELDSLVDANGKVKEGYEERASFITSTLKDALGVEIEMIDGQVQGMQNLRDSIDQVIDKKKAQIILDSQEKLYSEAINKQADAVRQLTEYENRLTEERQKKQEIDDAVSQAQEKMNNALRFGGVIIQQIARKELENAQARKTAYEQGITDLENSITTQKNLIGEYAYSVQQYETNMALAHAEKYDEMSTVSWDYVKDYSNATDAEKAMLEARVNDTQKTIDVLKEIRTEANAKEIDAEIAKNERLLTEQQQALDTYNQKTTSALGQSEIIWSDGLDDQLSVITGSKVEFRDAGDGQVQAYVDGVKVGEPVAKEEMAKMTTDAIYEVSKQKTDATTAGENIIDGVNNGIANKKGTVFSTIRSFGASLLSNLKSSLQEHSPSKATNEMGQYLLQGLNIGIKKKTKGVLNQVATLGNDIISTFDTSLSGGALNTDLAAQVQSNIPLSVSTNSNINSLNNNQENNYNNMLTAFKEALASMKIEMDDETMGKFVDKTVARTIYS